MGLSYDFTEVADFDNLTDDLKDAAPWATMGVGMNHISATNAEEFYARVSFYEKVTGAYRHQVDGDVLKELFFTRDEVQSLIGLRTNASILTAAKFKNNVYNMHTRYLK